MSTFATLRMDSNTVDVHPCPRCNGRHDGLVFRKLTEAGASPTKRWAPCPRNGEPILLTVDP